MNDTILTRTLWYFDDLERRSVRQDILTTSPRSMVVLGEAGMGKSTLLRQLRDRHGYVFTTARSLINLPDGTSRFADAATIVIDALDEVPAQADGDAVDQVIRKLAALGYPRFILSCRVADWRSATAIQGLADLYGEEPLELYLEPLDKLDAVTILEQALGRTNAEATTDTLEEKGLAGLWANPQTLSLVKAVVQAGPLPPSRGELFAQATRLLRKEHREEKSHAGLAGLAEATVLDAAGAAFATLILTGSEAISLRSAPSADDLPMGEVAALPGGGALAEALNSRLFAAVEAGRFTYAHRAIGEFLGARWLAQQADTSRKRRRIHALFNPDALVPASLRGLHAWLAWHSPDLANAVIRADAMGVVQYGDADTLTPPQATALLETLERLSRENPRFRDWTRYHVGGLAQPALLPQLSAILNNDDAEFGLRLLILQALQGSALVKTLAEDLRSLVRNARAEFALRSEAADRLVEAALPIDWPELVIDLRRQGDENGIRLAITLIDMVGYGTFNDGVLLDVTLAQLGQEHRTVGVLYGLRLRLPEARIDALLDGLAKAAAESGDSAPHQTKEEISDLAYGLLDRRMAHGPVASSRLWEWLTPLDEHGYLTEARQGVANRFKADPALRRAIQRHVLLDQEVQGNLWHAAWRMTDRSAGLALDEADVVALLDVLNDDDPRWRAVVELVRHNADEGEVVRVAAARFAVRDADGPAWLEGLRNPATPQWQLDEEARRLKRDTERQARWVEHRASFTRDIEKVRAGEFGLILNPAKAYLKLFADMGDGALDGPARLDEWLGPELRDAALAGFEAFLLREPAQPTAAEIAESFAQSRRWEAAHIIVAALAERHRTGRSFSDLKDERVMAGLFEVRHTRIDDHAGVPDLDQALTVELRGRGAWELVQRLYFEPQFVYRSDHIDGLYALMRDADDHDLATQLALEWLQRFPDMPVGPEAELLDHLVTLPVALPTLREITAQRRGDGTLDDQRRRNWDALGLLIDFEVTRLQLEAAPIDLELFWHVRSRLGRRSETRPIDLAPELLTWLLKRFRTAYPLATRPSGVSSGDSNAWDASDFIAGLIRRLGDHTTTSAIAALVELRDDVEDGYTDQFRAVAAEQKRKRIEADWTAPALGDVASAIEDRAPQTASQLQAVLLEELDRIQRELKGSDIDWYQDFLRNGVPRGEEQCRDALLKMLRPLPFGIQALPEGHLADDKRCDILCLSGELMTPIEVKGQWHRDLWTAADRQLDRLYVNDARAEAGIYLVLWFGSNSTKALKAPPKGVKLPASAADLRARLSERSSTTLEGRVAVVVLDLERPA